MNPLLPAAGAAGAFTVGVAVTWATSGLIAAAWLAFIVLLVTTLLVVAEHADDAAEDQRRAAAVAAAIARAYAAGLAHREDPQ